MYDIKTEKCFWLMAFFTVPGIAKVSGTLITYRVHAYVPRGYVLVRDDLDARLVPASRFIRDLRG